MVRSSPYSVVLFDAYETLWYQTRSHVEIWRGLLARLGHAAQILESPSPGLWLEPSRNLAQPSLL